MRHYLRVSPALSLLLLPTLVVGACRKPTPGPVDSVADHEAPPPSPNTLSAADEASGWKLLFDGQSLAGWHGYKAGSSAAANWQVEEGTLAWGGNGGDIVTDDTFENFELALEWRISEAGNSGVFFRVTEDHEFPWQTGPEMQILDDEKHGDGKNPKTSAGANYALHPPEGKVLRPVGEWNEARLVVKGANVEHWLNGKKVVSYELWTDGWKAQVAASKFSGMPDYGLRKSGAIVLQDHGDKVWFRNIKVRPL